MRLKNMVTLKKLKELKQIKRDNKVIYNLLNTIIGECEQDVYKRQEETKRK